MDNQIISLLTEIKSLIIGKSSRKWYTINEVSSMCSLSHSTIRRSVAGGSLKCSRRLGGKKLIFKISDVERWLNG